MKYQWILWCLVGCWGTAMAEPRAGMEAKASQGHLETVSSWWIPDPAWEGRWWWNEGGGAAWLRAGFFEVGPLVVSSSLEGQRAWAPGFTLSSGHWGLGFDLGSCGLWAIQRPEDYEAGVQVKTSAGPWTLAAGLDRTWSLEAFQPSVPPWVDRGRLGLTWKSQGWVAGGETSVSQAAGKTIEWFHRVRNTWTAPEGRLSLKASGFPWSAGVDTTWMGWSLGWEGKASNALGRWVGGWQGKAKNLHPWELGVGTGLEVAWYQGQWTQTVVISCDVPLVRGLWSCEYSGVRRETEIIQTVSAGWKEPGFGALARWRVEGFHLGWMGRGTSFDLTVNWSI